MVDINKQRKAIDVSGTGFRPVSTEIRKRLIVSLQAPHKAGKTRWALTAPGPIAYINFDVGLEGVVEPFIAAGKEIMESQYRLTGRGAKGKMGDVKNEAAVEMWERFQRDYFFAMDSGRFRTLVIDTGTEAYELIRLARFGKLAQVEPHHYGPVKAEFEEVIRAGLDSTTTNLILLHKVKDEYINDKKTGRKEFAGYSNMGFLVQVILELWRTNDEESGLVFHSRVLDARHQSAVDNGLIGMEFDSVSGMSDFPTLASMVFGAGREEWE